MSICNRFIFCLGGVLEWYIFATIAGNCSFISLIIVHGFEDTFVPTYLSSNEFTAVAMFILAPLVPVTFMVLAILITVPIGIFYIVPRHRRAKEKEKLDGITDTYTGGYGNAPAGMIMDFHTLPGFIRRVPD